MNTIAVPLMRWAVPVVVVVCAALLTVAML